MMGLEITNYKPKPLQQGDSNIDFLSQNLPKPLIIRSFVRAFLVVGSSVTKIVDHNYRKEKIF